MISGFSSGGITTYFERPPSHNHNLGRVKCQHCGAIFDKLYYKHVFCSTECMNAAEPKPLVQAVSHSHKIKASRYGPQYPLTISELDVAEFKAREVMPVFVRGGRAVYYLYGQYEVHFNGTADHKPFRTTDRELAEVVCEQLAREGV